MRRLMLGALGGLLGFAATSWAADPTATAYEQDFQQGEAGTVPDDLLVLDGTFAVQREGDQQFLELPGAPLETYGVLFGGAAKDNLMVTARIHGTSRGRRYPAFGVGLNGIGGPRLIVAPAKRKLELTRSDAVLASADYSWKTGTWTWFRLQLKPSGSGSWIVMGKAWPEGEAEPDRWLIEHTLDREPYPGKPSVWGKPYAGTPIRFDDLKLTPLSP